VRESRLAEGFAVMEMCFLLENGDQMDHLYGILVFELNPLL